MNDIPVAIAFALIMGMYMPLKALVRFRQGRAPGAELPVPTLRNSLIFSLWLMAVVAMGVAYDAGLVLFRPWKPTMQEVGIGLGMLLVWLVAREILKPWLRGAKRIESRLKPTNAGELPIWAVISITAGITEEIVYRGTLYQVLHILSGRWQVAALVVALIFALVHLNQGIRTVLFIFIVGAALQWLVLYSGSLYMAMIVHAVYDFVVGVLGLAERQKQDQAAAPT